MWLPIESSKGRGRERRTESILQEGNCEVARIKPGRGFIHFGQMFAIVLKRDFRVYEPYIFLIRFNRGGEFGMSVSVCPSAHLLKCKLVSSF